MMSRSKYLSLLASLLAAHHVTSAWTIPAIVVAPRTIGVTRSCSPHQRSFGRPGRGLQAVNEDDSKDSEDAFKTNKRRNYDDEDNDDEAMYVLGDEPTGQLHSSSPQNSTRTTTGKIIPTATTSAALEKKIRVAKAQAEIDRILSGPDPPFDVEAELQKVIRIAPLAQDDNDGAVVTAETTTTTLPHSDQDSTTQSSNDVASSSCKEQQLLSAELEAELYQAVKQQDYATAARHKQSLQQLHMDDSLAVLQVNAAFYRAFSNKDLRLMESLWLSDETATCIHPSHKPLVGAKAVCDSWRQMFESANGSFQRNWMEPCHIRVSVLSGATAVITCDERVYARRFVRGQKRHTELVNLLTATNIFRKVAGKWYLTHHHASWHADSDAAKQALRGSSSSSSSPALIASLRERQKANEKPDIGMDGILGIQNFGPLLGDSSKAAKEAQPPPTTRRIVMGSLSDILNGSLEDLLSGTSSEKSNSDPTKSSNGDDGVVDGNAIIQFHRIEAEDDEDDEEDEEEEVEEELEIVDSESSKEAVSIIKDWAESRGSKQTTKTSAPLQSKESLRQNCISSLRHLCSQGSISNKQKRVLLTDIISCSTKGEPSVVEVAYELLCAASEDNNDDEDIVEEEFADQCRVFAESLSDSHAI
jgi:SnoaL-like domain